MKFWKTFAVCSTLALSCIAFNGCSGNKTEVAVDLDGDGVISDWESLFEKSSSSSRIETVSNVVEISSFEELKAINDNVNDVKYYKLTKNIDCGGEELNINLGKSVLYGNNKVIKNFKLKEIGYSQGEGESATHIDANVYGFIYNGVAIYDLRLFVGYQNLEINDLNGWTFVSPLVNVGTIDNITIKGKLDVKRIKTEGLRGDNRVDVSLCMTNLSDIKDMISDDIHSPNITNVETIGVINYSEEMTNSRVRIGSIISHLSENGMVYGTKSSVNISAYSTGTLSVGGIVAENDDFVSTCEYLGEISTTYDPNSDNYIGGIAGKNLNDAEIKNCIVSGTINFDTNTVTSVRPKMTVGGVVGRNLGVVDYIENNSSININNTVDLQIGGICGSSEYGIFSNIINRAKITLTKCSDVKIAEITGISKYGHYEQIVDMSNITINNEEISSSVKLGMVTIFEDLQSSASDLKYNAEYSPTFKGILMTGKVLVNQKKVGENTQNFAFNYGLRNPYEYVVIDEDTGLPKQELRVNSEGKPIGEDGKVLEEGEQEIYDVVTATQTPDLYSKLFYLEGEYSIRKFSYATDEEPVQEGYAKADFTFAKNESKTAMINSVQSTRLNVVFFINDLGFKYGLNHNEIDLGTDTSLIDISKIKFNLSVDNSLEKFFEHKNPNGELAYFDNYIDEELKFDEDLDKNSEMYSYLNNLLLSSKTSAYIPLKISHKFASAVDPLTGDGTVTLENNFARNMQYLLNMIVGANPTLTELGIDKKEISESATGSVLTNYERLEVLDKEYRYILTFKVIHMTLSDIDNPPDNYIVYLEYKKSNIYIS